MTNNQVRFTLNPAELALIEAAKAGDSKAEARLWDMHEAAMRKVHDFGRTGTKCGKGIRSKFAQTFEEAMYDVYSTFKDAVRLYRPDGGASFRTFLTQKLRYAALDRIKAATPTCKLGEESVEVQTISWDELIETTGIEDSDDADYTSEELVQTQTGLYSDGAQAGAQNPSHLKVQKMLSLYPAQSSKRKLLEAYLICADLCDGKPRTADICEMVGCTKQNYSIQMHAIARDMQNHGITLISKAA